MKSFHYSSNPRIAGFDLRNNKAQNLTLEQVRYNAAVRIIVSFAVLLGWAFFFLLLIAVSGILLPENMQ